MISTDPQDAAGACVAILGGGGKTSLLHRLGNDYSQFFPRVLMTSLTLSGRDHENGMVYLDEAGLDGWSRYFEERNPVCVMRKVVNKRKLEGVTVEELRAMKQLADLTLFECDGARNLPLKAHNDRDPEVPEWATHVIILIGADAVGETLAGGKIHRPDIFKERWQVGVDEPLSAEKIAEVVTTKKGYLTKVPDHFEPIYLVNKADNHLVAARKLGEAIVRRGDWPVYIGSLAGGTCERIS